MSESEEEFPSMQDFCVALPLYTEIHVTDAMQSDLYNFITERANIDSYCVDCQQSSVFIGPKVDIQTHDYDFHIEFNRIFTREFFCSRVNSHEIYFHFRLKECVLTKVGQSPAMADLSEAELRPYNKVLSSEEYRELTRSVGLASHGVGIGSFVYLRRIFERLIDEARVEAAKFTGWDDAAFQQARMDDKIELLKIHLPPFLTEQRKLYSILSKGIHSLTENECLEAFPAVRVGIELILDQKVSAKLQQEKMNEAKKRIGILQQKLAKP